MNESTTSGAADYEGSCPWCSTQFSKVYHTGHCPKVKSIEYHPNGLIKRIEFIDGADGFAAMEDFITTLNAAEPLPRRKK